MVGEATAGDIIQKSMTPNRRVVVEPEAERLSAVTRSTDVTTGPRTEASKRRATQIIASDIDVV